MKKGLLVTSLTLAAAAVLTAGVAMAADDAAAPKLTGKAYVAGHGGHLAVLNLATGDLDRIVITGAGGELEGKIAGLQLDAEHKGAGGGTHGQAMVGRNMYVGLLNGKMMKYDLDKGELKDLGQVGQKFCGTVSGPGGNLYCEDMADGKVYVFDPSKDKAADVIPVGMSVCGIGWDKGDKHAFVSDMVQGKVFVLDWKTKKTIKDIPIGTFIHQSRTNPDRSEFWVTSPNEFKVEKDGPKPNSVAGKGKSELVIVDMDKMEVKSRIDLSAEQAYPHDLAFTADGKYALVTARTYSDDSILLTIDTKTHKILAEKSLCKGCHEPAGIKVKIDQGSPLLCGIEVDWSAK